MRLWSPACMGLLTARVMPTSSHTAPSTLAYVPRLFRGRVVAGRRPEAAARGLQAALLWVDVSGFTPIAERLSREGASGVERLSTRLDAFYRLVIRVVEQLEGDVQFFAGDGALALWHADDRTGATRRAARAARVICERVPELEGEETLEVKATVGFGRVEAMIVGSREAGWLHLVAGEALSQIVARPEHASRQVLLSRQAADALALPDVVDAVARGRFALGSGLLDDESPRSAPAPALGSEPGGSTALLPDPVQSLVSRGTLAAEFRRLTTAFVDLSELGYDVSFTRVQSLVSRFQRLLAEYGGTVHQVVQDDKGTTAVGVFGLPGTSHDDNAVRAVRFARAVQADLRSRLERIPCGVATGSVFCGDFGTESRREFALIGATMNRAARLMKAAGTDILVDAQTFEAAERRLSFSVEPPQLLKGFGEPLPAYRGGELRRAPAADPNFVGREPELSVLKGVLDRYRETGRGGVLVVEGPPGIGKTALLARAAEPLSGEDVELLHGRADSLDTRTPYFGLRPVLRALFEVSAAQTRAELTANLEQRVRDAGRDPELLPLLNAALGCELPESSLSRQMTPAVRGEVRRELIAALFESATAGRRVVILLEDTHWLDTASWVMLRELLEWAPEVQWLLDTRPLEGLPEAARAFLEDARYLRLVGLGSQEVRTLLAETWDAHEIPDEVVTFVAGRTGGNPLFCREIAITLLGQKRVRVEAGRCVVASDFGAKAERALPTTLAELIKSRIDTLDADSLVTLKIASVIGQHFEPTVVDRVRRAVEPLGSHADDVGPALETLARKGLVRASPEGEHRRTFSHALIQVVTYDLLPESQKRALHLAVGQTLEALGRPLSRAYARLSHHYEQAREPAPCARYSALAAAEALDGYANEDAVHLYERTLAADHQARGEVGVDLARAHHHAGIAQACYSLIRAGQASTAFRRAVQHTGFREPRGLLDVAFNVLGLLLRRLFRSIQPRRPAPARAEVDASTSAESRIERRRLAVGLLPEWSVLELWRGRLVSAAAKLLESYSLAGAISPSGVGAHAVASTGYLIGMTPLRSLGEAEILRAIDEAEASQSLSAMASTRVLLGMYYTLMGRPNAAVAPLELAQAPAERLGSGLWKHRTRFMLAEPLFMLGRFAEARDVFLEAAVLSMAAEPPVAGLAGCLAALADARLGNVDGALERIDGVGGMALFAGPHLPLQKFASLGARAEALLMHGQHDEALSCAREAARLDARGLDCHVFFAGLHGHGGVVRTLLELWERKLRAAGSPPHVDLDGLVVEARRACRSLERFARLYPCASPRALLARGWFDSLGGNPRRAARRLSRCARQARAMQLPYELGHAHRLLARVTSTAEGRDHARQALDIFRQHHISMGSEAPDG